MSVRRPSCPADAQHSSDFQLLLPMLHPSLKYPVSAGFKYLKRPGILLQESGAMGDRMKGQRS